MFTIFEAIIDNNLERVKLLIGNKFATLNDIEPDSFVGKEDNVCVRHKPKTALELAQSLNRKEIVKYLIENNIAII